MWRNRGGRAKRVTLNCIMYLGIRWPYRVKQSVSASFADAWSFVAPLLFGLVGTELILDELIKMDSMRVLGISEFNEPKGSSEVLTKKN